MNRINLWSSPRNISTALMYSFAQRRDMTVVDEPLYAHYLTHTGTEALHPGREEILRSQNPDGEAVVRKVLLGSYPTPVVVFKQMTHHLQWLDRSFLTKMRNVLLIRDPRAIIASYAQVVPNPSIDDVGIRLQYELSEQLIASGHLHAVVDARELLLSPTAVLRKLCDRLDLAFDEAMLSWPAGPRPEDGIWARYWYGNLHRSTGFQPYQEKEITLRSGLERLAEECRPYYEQLREMSLRAED